MLSASQDGEQWEVIADYSDNQRDMPHGYIELPAAVEARYIRYEHVHCSTQNLAISEFRVFGNGKGDVLEPPADFTVKRQEDRRNAMLSWTPDLNAIGYVIYWGIDKDKLNLSALMYDQASYELRALNTDQAYYYQVEAFNENGVSERSEIIYTE